MGKSTDVGDTMRKDADKIAKQRDLRERHFLFGMVLLAFILVVAAVIILNRAGVM